MAYKQELEALQRWIWAAAGLKSQKQEEAPPKVTRPMLLWEAPDRGKDRDLGRWRYVVRVTQYGRLFAADLDQLLDFQDLLLSDLEEQYEVGGLLVYDRAGPGAAVLGKLQNVAITFSPADGLDIPVRITYEVTYSRKRVVPPAPTYVGTRAQETSCKGG